MTKQEPVLLFAVLPAVLVELGGAAQQLASDHSITGILLAAGALLTGVGGALARSKVSPTEARRPNEAVPKQAT